MPFSEEYKGFGETRKRSSSEYVKFTPDYRVVLRVLNPTARTLWKHWIPQANGGRGMGAVCANTAPGLNICPIEQSVAHLPKDAEERKEVSARKRFVVNVLDRTLFTTCKHCNTLTPGKSNPAVAGKTCVNCGGDLKGHDFAPLNRVKILEHGPRLFNQQLNNIERIQKEELGEKAEDITKYDITFTTIGDGRDKVITALPQDPKELPEDVFIDPETGEPQKLFDLELLAEPPSTEELSLMLQGATIEQLNAVRGIE